MLKPEHGSSRKVRIPYALPGLIIYVGLSMCEPANHTPSTLCVFPFLCEVSFATYQDTLSNSPKKEYERALFFVNFIQYTVRSRE